MTTHELARKLLEQPDTLVLKNGQNGDMLPVLKVETCYVLLDSLKEYDSYYETSPTFTSTRLGTVEFVVVVS